MSHVVSNLLTYYPVSTSFSSLQMEKFRLLDMTEYSRVLYLDGDLLPFCSLDYLFNLSEPADGQGPPLLKENVIHTMFDHEPANGGFFMLTPGIGMYDKARAIIQRHEDNIKRTHGDGWSEIEGWGHVIEIPDQWRSLVGAVRSGNKWMWYAAIADQGLLYYWTKYYQKSVSIIIGDEIEQWSAWPNGTMRLEDTLLKPLQSYSCLPLDMDHDGHYASNDLVAIERVPYRDFRHFSGASKPWIGQAPPQVDSLDQVKSSYDYWFYLLRQLNKKLGMGIDVDNLNLGQLSLGRRMTMRGLLHAISD
jgi:hypothetical protein